MGLPIEKLVIATNANDILVRTLETGAYTMNGVVPTSSPSMDIQVSSNFERLLFEAHGRDSEAVRGLMARLAQSGGFTLEDGAMSRIRDEFAAGRCDEEATAAPLPGLSRAAAICLIRIRRPVSTLPNSFPSLRCPWLCSPPPTPRNSRRRSKRPAAFDRNCRRSCGP